MKKWVKRIGGILLVLLVLGFVFRGQITNALVRANIAPKNDFVSYTPPVAPDYGQDSAWAALPEITEGSDFVPKELHGSDSLSPESKYNVAVFFIHPTTYYAKSGWNAPIDDAGAKSRIDDLVMPAQASVFNLCCAIYAPYYRQATLYSYWVLEGSGQKALDYAYGDVERAFDAFLSRIDERPFILAAHSQGGHHLKTLLKKRISGTPLKDKMVAAYPIGIAVDPVSFSAAAPDIPVCATAAQTGCYVTWNSRGIKSKTWEDLPGATCVNPLSWKTDGAQVPASQNQGSLAVGEIERLD
ncbi:MAG: DUF3089 domain-containing protein, partial [Robiginitomaculum sp.]|nr:DUF3089 domain-containing protein [Robiginitomaculum sp.]